MREKVLNIVSKICEIKSTDCRGLNKRDLARKLLNLANVPTNAEIEEIPLDWNNQVVILFLIPGDKNYYSLFAGIGNNGKFYFELSITGVLENNGYFRFFESEKIIDSSYFERERAHMMMKSYRKERKNTMKKELFVGTRDAVIVTADRENVFEIAIAYGYDKENKAWIEGHYFSVSGNISVQDKMDTLRRAFDYWATHDYR